VYISDIQFLQVVHILMPICVICCLKLNVIVVLSSSWHRIGVQLIHFIFQYQFIQLIQSFIEQQSVM